jgi:hypothetical protein
VVLRCRNWGSHADALFFPACPHRSPSAHDTPGEWADRPSARHRYGHCFDPTLLKQADNKLGQSACLRCLPPLPMPASWRARARGRPARLPARTRGRWVWVCCRESWPPPVEDLQCCSATGTLTSSHTHTSLPAHRITCASAHVRHLLSRSPSLALAANPQVCVRVRRARRGERARWKDDCSRALRHRL